MLSQTLQQLCESGQTTPKQLASVAGCHVNTVYQWLAGRTPATCAIRRWITRHPNPVVQEEVVAAVSGGKAHVVRDEESQSATGGGRATPDDVMDAALETTAHTTDLLRQARAAQQSGRITESQAAGLSEAISRLRRDLDTLSLLIHRLIHRRKPAKGGST